MLELVPVSLKEANAFVERHHRHHKLVVGHKFSVAAAVDAAKEALDVDIKTASESLTEWQREFAELS